MALSALREERSPCIRPYSNTSLEDSHVFLLKNQEQILAILLAFHKNIKWFIILSRIRSTLDVSERGYGVINLHRRILFLQEYIGDF